MSLIGETLGGRYVVKEELGSGAMGVVYKAEHVTLHRPVVIKTLRSELVANAKIRERFQNEALIQANLTHTHIVRATDFLDEEERGLLAIVMDFVAGPDLEAHLYDEMGGSMPLPRIGAIMLPVMEAMEFAHNSGVVHRDLKPANIMLDRGEGVEIPKVTDFGIAKLLGEGASTMRTRSGAVIGTPSFMPPEQLKGAADIDHRVDIYAMGAILYQLASGALPFGDGTEYEVTYKILGSEAPPPLSQVRPELGGAFSDVVSRAMAFDREARFQSVKAFKEALKDALEAPAVVAPDATSAADGAPSSAAAEAPSSSSSSSEVVATSAESPPPSAAPASPQRASSRRGSPSLPPMALAALGGGMLVAVLLVFALVSGKGEGGSEPAVAAKSDSQKSGGKKKTGKKSQKKKSKKKTKEGVKEEVARAIEEEEEEPEVLPPVPFPPPPERLKPGSRVAAKSFNSRGFQAYKRGAHRESEENYLRALRIDPTYAIAWFNLACMQALGQRYDDALQSLANYLEAKPDADVMKKVRRDSDFSMARRDARFMRGLSELVSRGYVREYQRLLTGWKIHVNFMDSGCYGVSQGGRSIFCVTTVVGEHGATRNTGYIYTLKRRGKRILRDVEVTNVYDVEKDYVEWRQITEGVAAVKRRRLLDGGLVKLSGGSSFKTPDGAASLSFDSSSNGPMMVTLTGSGGLVKVFKMSTEDESLSRLVTIAGELYKDVKQVMWWDKAKVFVVEFGYHNCEFGECDSANEYIFFDASAVL